MIGDHPVLGCSRGFPRRRQEKPRGSNGALEWGKPQPAPLVRQKRGEVVTSGCQCPGFSFTLEYLGVLWGAKGCLSYLPPPAPRFWASCLSQSWEVIWGSAPHGKKLSLVQGFSGNSCVPFGWEMLLVPSGQRLETCGSERGTIYQTSSAAYSSVLVILLHPWLLLFQLHKG